MFDSFDFSDFDTLGAELSRETKTFDAAPELEPTSKATVLVTVDGHAAWEMFIPWRWLLMPLSYNRKYYTPAAEALSAHLKELGLNAANVEIFYRDERGQVQTAEIDFCRRLGVGPTQDRDFQYLPRNM